MIKFRYLVLAAAAFGSFACTPQSTSTSPVNSNAANANANVKAAAPAAAAPSKETLMAQEKQAWEAWKNNDPKFFEDFLSDRFMGFGPNGREDKAANIKRLTDMKCDVKSFSMSDDQLHMLGQDVAVLSFKADQDAACGGTKIPSTVWVSSAYIREGDKWKALSYIETAAVDPNAPAAKPAAPAPAANTAPSGTADSLTEALMAVETKAWDAWKNRDAKAMEDLMAANFTFVGASGRFDRAAALKQWSEPKCEGLAYTFSDPKAVSITPDVALATYKADVKGSCDGKPQTPALWVASFSMKDGGSWKNAYYTDMTR